MTEATPEEWEEFNRVERESKAKQESIRGIKRPTREQLMAEVTILTELVRVLSDRVAELEKTEQEPVAYLSNKRQRLNIELKPQTFVEIPTATDWEMPLYMKPLQRTWVGLKRDEQSFVYSSLHNATSREDSFWVDFANAIEKALKEKNYG
jgi:hypothetical protein